MNNNKVLYVVIVVLLLVIVGGGAFWFGSNRSMIKDDVQPANSDIKSSIEDIQSVDEQQVFSEQPDQQKFNEYFTEAAVAKLPVGVEFSPFNVEKTSVLNAGEKFCTTFSMKKQIIAGSLAAAVYDINAKKDVQPKSSFPQKMGPGGSIGCEDLAWTTGKYEYKIYVDDVLAVVAPFEVK